MSDRLCLCGCNEPATGRYAVKRGHGARVPSGDRPWVQQHRLHQRLERSTHIKESKPTPQTRACLKCERRFRSEGPHHRLCQGCRKGLEAQPSAIEARRLPRAAMRAPREL